MLLRFPKQLIQSVVDQYKPYSELGVFFAFTGNDFLESNMTPEIVPNKEFRLKLNSDRKFYELEIETDDLPEGWHKGKPVVPIQKVRADGRVTVTWIDCPAKGFGEMFRQEQKRKNWEFLVEK